MRAQALALLLAALPAAAAPDALDRALDAELARSMASLREPGYAAPYYISLTAVDVDGGQRRCPMGARAAGSRFEQRLVMADLRVGGYEMDNRPVLSPQGQIGRSLARDGDEFALRHELWRLLDSSYKEASAAYLRKQALRVSRGKTEYDFDDLSRETPRVAARAAPAGAWDVSGLERLCAAGSAAFRREPGLLRGEAGYRFTRQRSRLRDSEGSRVDNYRDVVEFELEAVDISTDGLRLQALRRYAATSPAGLPTAAELARDAAAMAQDLKALKAASSTSPFSAPTLVDPSVASALVLSLSLRLSGEELRNPTGAQSFRDKMGKSVLPADFTLVDDPTRGLFAYAFDDQGIPARRVTLIEKGVLRDHLLSRYPVIGFPKSNGHGRAYPGYWPEGAPANLLLTTERPQTEQQLLARLREECLKRGKPYGLWVKSLRAFSQQQGTGGHGSIRILPGLLYLVNAQTGEITLTRDLDVVGTPLVLLGNMLAAGRDATTRNFVYSVPMSVTTPSLLLSEAELQRAETRPEKAPILPAPR